MLKYRSTCVHTREPRPAVIALIRHLIMRAGVAIVIMFLPLIHPAAQAQGGMASAQQYLSTIQMKVQQSIGIAMLTSLVTARWRRDIRRACTSTRKARRGGGSTPSIRCATGTRWWSC